MTIGWIANRKMKLYNFVYVDNPDDGISDIVIVIAECVDFLLYVPQPMLDK